MSDATSDFDLREHLAHIDRSIAETRKFVAEHDKLYAEREKLAAEAAKFDRERFLSPWLAVAAICGGVGGTIAGATAILRLIGIIH